ncbi:histone deacetylase family protein [Halomonas daqingensis]|uniref:Histone deacetylase family protein n=1 Tax=Billgrantia desiderata TaxID=52021 RepID=A0AAW4YPU2_9GAMM|nr:histone deacetylase family protein [Halomonas desiderata]MCE8011351.1 histone deacetylase family protein [Halomonas desiderata]MCE8027261.1 histone deacetylase family protein [Halomonas desiderata]MCE8050904.1 histone deacetylase family protein [Halomonas desiderata]NIC36127.1 histone deacetylase family protein [Halomonas desiderata]OUE38617.1 deacetylase [Halomonas desiderata SP1]
MITAFISHPDCDLHHMGPEHPESPLRLEAIRARLALSGLLQQTMQSEARPASEEELARVHPLRHLRALDKCVPATGIVTLDSDTLMNPDSLSAARVAAGAVIRGVDQVYRGQADNVFCAVRPPGHHAEATDAMGFCFYNNVAVGAAHARARHGVRRIAILDFDVHQCNGTIDIFKDDPDILICTSFQYPFYPWRYLRSEWQNVVNTPLEAGTDSAAFRKAIEDDWLPALHAFKPELVLVSAGFDAHREDPLAELCLEDEDYYWITRLALDIAALYADNRLVSVLEGGYDLDSLGRSVEAHVKALLGLPFEQ